jgi:putative membrane protein insertion efficiency factor
MSVLSQLFVKLIKIYQLFLSPLKYVLFGPNAGCRYQPTCSNYAIDCFKEHPFFKALWLATKRIFRCHPWGGFGYDPVPKGRSGKAVRRRPERAL